MRDDEPGHPPATDLVAVARGAVRGSVAAAVQQHCMVCDDCAASFDAVIVLRRAVALPARGRRRSLCPELASTAVH